MSAFGATPGPITHEFELTVFALYGPEYVWPVPSTPVPAAVPATCEPCPLQSSGFGSGCGMSAGEPAAAAALYASPTRSMPPLTRGAFGPNIVGSAGSVSREFASLYAATVPGPLKFACV